VARALAHRPASPCRPWSRAPAVAPTGFLEAFAVNVRDRHSIAWRGASRGPLFRTIGRGSGKLTRKRTHTMIGRCAPAPGIAIKLGNQGFRATGITAYLGDGGALWKSRRCLSLRAA